jgi:RimJ/RimL family protein N-acetyltransferase
MNGGDRAMAANIFEGRLVRLRALEPEDWDSHYAWDQNSDVTRALDYIWFPRSRAVVRRWTEARAEAFPEDDNFHFHIETLAGEPVGSIGVHRAEPRTGTFSYGVMVAPEHWRKGYASEAVLLVLRYYFQERRYQKVTVTVDEYNEASQRLHRRLGFQQEGQLRRMAFTGGRFYDHLMFGLTREEFEQLHAARLPAAEP